MRMDGKVVATFEQFSQIEQVLGPYGGQVASFEWVFSPKGADGAPVPMFDRATGAVDPKVVGGTGTTTTTWPMTWSSTGRNARPC